MKITVSNLSSNPLAVPAPINVMLGGGKQATVVLKDQDWKAAQAHAGIQRLLSLKMLAIAVLDQPAHTSVAAAPAPTPAPEEKAPKAPEKEPAPDQAPTREPEAAAAPAEPEAPAETSELASEPAPVAAEPTDEPKAVSKKKKKASSSSW